MRQRDAKASAQVRKVAARAVRRLSVLEYVLLFAAAGFAIVAGALSALMLRTAFGLAFRPTWIVASLALFVIPAGIAYLRARRLEAGAEGEEPKTQGGERRERHGG